MTLTLELSPDLEARVRPLADANGQTLEAFALSQLEQSATTTPETDEGKRRALLLSLRGRAKGKGPTVDEFLAERAAEGRAEAGL